MVLALVVAVCSGSEVAPVHLKVVEGSSAAVSHRMPCPARHPLSGPCCTEAIQRKPPLEWTKPVAGSYAPPPVSSAAPVGKPAILGLLNPNALFAWAVPMLVAPTTKKMRTSRPVAGIEVDFITHLLV